MNIVRKYKLHKNFNTPLSYSEQNLIRDIKSWLNNLSPFKNISDDNILFYKDSLSHTVFIYNLLSDNLTILNYPHFMLMNHWYLTESERKTTINFFFREKYKKEPLFRNEHHSKT